MSAWYSRAWKGFLSVGWIKQFTLKYDGNHKWGDGLHWGQQPSPFVEETPTTMSLSSDPSPETVIFSKETPTTITYT